MTTVSNSAPNVRAWPAWLVLAVAEIRLITRNRTFLLTALTFPVALGWAVLFMGSGPDGGTAGATAALQLGVMLSFTVFMGSTMTLASRREQLYLQRLRTSPASTASIVAGLIVPLAAVVLIQSALVLGATAIGLSAPAQPLFLIAAFVMGVLTCAGLGFVTATFTKTSESAQVTTTPGFGVFFVGLLWVIFTPTGELTWYQLAVPGGAVAELMRLGWDGAAVADVSVLITGVLASLVATAGLGMAAVRFFSWHPRVLDIYRTRGIRHDEPVVVALLIGH